MKGYKESFSDIYSLMKWEDTCLLEVTETSAKIKMYKIDIIVYNDMNREIYARIYFKNFEFSLDEFMSDVYGIHEGATILLSKEFEIDEYIKRVLKLIDRYIYIKKDDLDFETIKERIIASRKKELCEYQLSIIESEASKAFEEKRYKDVIEIYSEANFLNEIQRKRIEISKKRIGMK